MVDLEMQDAPAGTGAPGAETHKLWGGRFAGAPVAALDALNRSIGVDIRLWPYDVRLSKAWAVALWNAGVLTLEESKRLEQGLDAVAVARKAAEKIGGGGGGRADLAEAGGKNPAGLPEAYEVAKSEIASARG
jgi:hypothetical protein